LFGEFGCFSSNKTPWIKNECGKNQKKSKEVTPLAKSFYPLQLTNEQDKAWEDLVAANIKLPEGGEKKKGQ